MTSELTRRPLSTHPTTIAGPLYAETVGPVDAPVMVFVHPNPMDSSCWLFQMAHFSTWFRCVAIDLPGYGRSPVAGDGLTMEEIADACWDAVDAATGRTEGPCVLVGCSVGSNVVQHMYHRRPERTGSVVLCGTGYSPVKDFAPRRIASYTELGIGFRYDYTLQDLSPAFGATPLGGWLASLFSERNGLADVPTIIRMFEALGVPDPEWLQKDLDAPVLILTGELDNAHKTVFALRDRLPDVELVTVAGAGHACQIEQPWVFDTEMIRFLRAHGDQRLPSAPGAWPQG